MPILTLHPSGITLEVPKGTNLMEAITQAGLPVGSSCGGQGVCGKCFVQVLEGMENISTPSELEKKLLARDDHGDHIRISCQSQILGSITVTTTYW